MFQINQPDRDDSIGRSGITLAVSLAMLLFATAATSAQDAEPFSLQTRPVDVNDDVLFPQGTQMFSTEARYVVGIEDGEDIPSLGLAYDHFFVDNWSFGAELNGYGYFKDGDDTVAVSLGVRLRHHLATSDNSSLFVSVAFAPFYADSPVPANGTRFNFVSRAGIGGMFRVDEDCFLTVGVDYWHVSNGQLAEGDNPAINGFQGFIGIGWTF